MADAGAAPLLTVLDGNRKSRGAFFTPPAIAEFLAAWALASGPGARVLDPTCGDGVFLRAAGDTLRSMGGARDLRQQVFGVDVHAASLSAARSVLNREGLDAT